MFAHSVAHALLSAFSTTEVCLLNKLINKFILITIDNDSAGCNGPFIAVGWPDITESRSQNYIVEYH